MRIIGVLVAFSLAAACSESSPNTSTAARASTPASTEIPPAAEQPVDKREKISKPFLGDLDGVIERGYIRILVAPSRTHFQTVDGRHQGRAVDAGVALAQKLTEQANKEIFPVFIETPDDQLVKALLAGRGDIAANLLLTFERDEQVAFAPPIKTGIRELVVTDANPLKSLEDVGGRLISVRKNSDHHLSLIRLNEQLQNNSRRQAVIVFDAKAKTEEDLLDSVNAGRIRATVVHDYIYDRWRRDLLKVATTNRDVAVSQDGAISWVSRKDAPLLITFLKEFFSAHTLSF
jgi:ABC-type amino acid transport substrate-binding protein